MSRVAPRLGLLGRRLLCSRPSSVKSVIHPGGPGVSDAIGLLEPQRRLRINEKINDVRSKTGAEMAVVLLSDIDGGATPIDVLDYADFVEDLFEHWGVGRRGVNDGVVLAVFKEGRRVEVRTGRALRDVISSSWINEMTHREMVPLFRKGEHARAVEHGTDLLVARILKPGAVAQLADTKELVGSAPFSEGKLVGTSSAPVRFQAGKRGSGESRGGSESRGGGYDNSYSFDKIVIGGLFTFIPCAIIYQERKEYVRRNTHDCPQNGNQRTWLLPTEESRLVAKLTPCQLKEREVGSVQHTLLECPHCGLQRLDRRRNYASRYHACSDCGCKTEKTTTYVLEQATEEHGGRQQNNSCCEHCDHRRTWTQATAKLSRPSSSSSSSGGGGGFGGGSSGGGSSGGASWLLGPAQSDDDLSPRAPSEKAEVAYLRLKAWVAAATGRDSEGEQK